MSIDRADLPQNALLIDQAMPDDYLDCFSANTSAKVSLENYVAAFYTTWLFKLERLVLRIAGYPSADHEARALVQDERQEFAAWKLEARAENQILMRDVTGATCSWLMVQPQESGTRLYFGSGVRARKQRADGSQRLPLGYRALIGLHVLYSRALLAATLYRLNRQ